MPIEDLQQHQALANALASPDSWPAAAHDLHLIQTHISSVLLAGNDAYKLKKPLDLGFLDYSSLEKRRHYCEEEIRLNGRLAPDIYLGVVPITGSLAHPHVGGEGEPIEWAVHMRRFDPDAVLSECPQHLNIALIDTLAEDIAAFHQAAAVAPPEFGSPDEVAEHMADNVRQIRARRSAERAQLDRLWDWTEQRLADCSPLIERRRSTGHIRECHGDLHLGNIVLIDERPVVFDGIEFNPGLRYIDVMADLAFLTMDLSRMGRDDLARRLLDRYLRHTGDYDGLPLLRLYEVYRAMVRAKVAAIRTGERDLSAAGRELVVAELRRYLRVATQLTRPAQRGLVITCGVSGSGKSLAADQLLAALPSVRIASDVERKRLAGLAPQARTDSGLDAELYSPAMTERTYQRLAELAEAIVRAGLVAVVDATFLDPARRRDFAELAAWLQVPFVILDCDAPQAVLEQRVRARQVEGLDVSEADVRVLHKQLAHRQPLDERERQAALPVRPEQPLDVEVLRSLLGE
jgi:aminoglycoside phosphotransferase family enzyme/predicted kinase